MFSALKASCTSLLKSLSDAAKPSLSSAARDAVCAGVVDACTSMSAALSAAEPASSLSGALDYVLVPLSFVLVSPTVGGPRGDAAAASSGGFSSDRPLLAALRCVRVLLDRVGVSVFCFEGDPKRGENVLTKLLLLLITSCLGPSPGAAAAAAAAKPADLSDDVLVAALAIVSALCGGVSGIALVPPPQLAASAGWARQVAADAVGMVLLVRQGGEAPPPPAQLLPPLFQRLACALLRAPEASPPDSSERPLLPALLRPSAAAVAAAAAARPPHPPRAPALAAAVAVCLNLASNGRSGVALPCAALHCLSALLILAGRGSGSGDGGSRVVAGIAGMPSSALILPLLPGISSALARVLLANAEVAVAAAAAKKGGGALAAAARALASPSSTGEGAVVAAALGAFATTLILTADALNADARSRLQPIVAALLPWVSAVGEHAALSSAQRTSLSNATPSSTLLYRACAAFASATLVARLHSPEEQSIWTQALPLLEANEPLQLPRCSSPTPGRARVACCASTTQELALEPSVRAFLKTPSEEDALLAKWSPCASGVLAFASFRRLLEDGMGLRAACESWLGAVVGGPRAIAQSFEEDVSSAIDTLLVAAARCESKAVSDDFGTAALLKRFHGSTSLSAHLIELAATGWCTMASRPAADPNGEVLPLASNLFERMLALTAACSLVAKGKQLLFFPSAILKRLVRDESSDVNALLNERVLQHLKIVLQQMQRGFESTANEQDVAISGGDVRDEDAGSFLLKPTEASLIRADTLLSLLRAWLSSAVIVEGDGTEMERAVLSISTAAIKLLSLSAEMTDAEMEQRIVIKAASLASMIEKNVENTGTCKLLMTNASKLCQSFLVETQSVVSIASLTELTMEATNILNSVPLTTRLLHHAQHFSNALPAAIGALSAVALVHGSSLLPDLLLPSFIAKCIEGLSKQRAAKTVKLEVDEIESRTIHRIQTVVETALGCARIVSSEDAKDSALLEQLHDLVIRSALMNVLFPRLTGFPKLAIANATPSPVTRCHSSFDENKLSIAWLSTVLSLESRNDTVQGDLGSHLVPLTPPLPNDSSIQDLFHNENFLVLVGSKRPLFTNCFLDTIGRLRDASNESHVFLLRSTALVLANGICKSLFSATAFGSFASVEAEASSLLSLLTVATNERPSIKSDVLSYFSSSIPGGSILTFLECGTAIVSAWSQESRFRLESVLSLLSSSLPLASTTAVEVVRSQVLPSCLARGVNRLSILSYEIPRHEAFFGNVQSQSLLMDSIKIRQHASFVKLVAFLDASLPILSPFALSSVDAFARAAVQHVGSGLALAQQRQRASLLIRAETVQLVIASLQAFRTCARSLARYPEVLYPLLADTWAHLMALLDLRVMGAVSVSPDASKRVVALAGPQVLRVGSAVSLQTWLEMRALKGHELSCSAPPPSSSSAPTSVGVMADLLLFQNMRAATIHVIADIASSPSLEMGCTSGGEEDDFSSAAGSFLRKRLGDLMPHILAEAHSFGHGSAPALATAILRLLAALSSPTLSVAMPPVVDNPDPPAIHATRGAPPGQQATAADAGFPLPPTMPIQLPARISNSFVEPRVILARPLDVQPEDPLGVSYAESIHCAISLIARSAPPSVLDGDAFASAVTAFETFLN